VCRDIGIKTKRESKERVTKSLTLLHKLAVFKFYPNLFEISFDKSCVTSSMIQGEKFQRSLTFTRSMKKKIHSSPLCKKPTLKKEEI